MKEKMDGKWLPHGITVLIFVVFIVLGLACASTPGVDRDTRNRINELARSRSDSEMFTKPPLEGEVVLDTFQDTLDKRTTTTISSEEAQAYNNRRVLPNYNRPEFYPYEAAARLLIRASQRFPDIDIEELDVRSLRQVGDIRIQTNMNPNPIPDPGVLLGLPPVPPKYTFYADEYFTFEGLIVRRSPEINYGN